MKCWKLFASIFFFLFLVLFISLYVLLSRYDYNSLKPQIIQKVHDATGRNLTFKGDIKLKIGLTPSLAIEGVSLQNAPWGSQPDMITAKHFDVKVAILPLIKGTIQIKRFILIEPRILIETDPSGKSNLAFETPKAQGSEKPKKPQPKKEAIKLPALALNQVRIEKGSFIYKNGQSKKNYEVKLNSLRLEGKNASSPVSLKTKVFYEKEVFEIFGTLGPVAALINPDKPWPVDLTAKNRWVNLSIKGVLQNLKTQPQLDLNVRMEGNDIGAAVQAAGAALPMKGPFKITARLQTKKPKVYQLTSINIKVLASDLSGSASFDLNNLRPALSGDLSSKNLDLKGFFTQPSNSQGQDKTPKLKKHKHDKIFSPDPLSIEGLNKVDVALNIRFDKVLVPKLAIDNLDVEAKAKNGHLVIKPFKARIGEGNFEGHLNLQSQGNRLSLTAGLEITQLNLGNMLKELQVTETVEGTLDGRLNCKSSGNSIATLMGNLDGVIIAIMSQGRIQNKYLDLLGGDLSSSLFRVVNPGGEKEQYTDINCMVSRIDVREGLGEYTVLACDTKRMTLTGEGTINLKTEKLNIALNPAPKEGLSTGGGKVSLSMSELAKPFKLGGTLAHPSLKLDSKRAAMTLGKGMAGALLFGPVGAASSLLGSKTGEENLCLIATEAAQKGIKLSEMKKSGEEKGTVSKAGEGIKNKGGDVGSGLKKLFGR
jgi:uncharacterized protein involved in outer membrane biogenesis